MCEYKTIFIAGYQHSGTSVLRRLIGSHPSVFEVSVECVPKSICQKKLLKGNVNNLKHVVCKSPIIWFTDVYKKIIEEQGDYRINIARNPLDVFSSLYLRYKNYDPSRRNYEDVRHWVEWARYFLDSTPDRDLNIKYEDLFVGEDPNMEAIDRIISHCGLTPCPEILSLKQESECPVCYSCVPKEEPDRHQHEAFRSWQINQPLRNQTNKNRHLLSDRDVDFITKLPEFQRLYGADAP